MTAEKLLMKNEDFNEAWELFINDGILERNLLRNVIADSWLRCKKKGIDPYNVGVKIELSEEELKQRLVEFDHLLKIAKPFMYSLCKIVGNTNFIVRLTDKDGYVLECSGDKNLIQTHGILNKYKGCNVKEEVVGTNAIGITLITGKPIQVLGSEHYCKQYHKWTSSACPIKDENQNIIGILSMSGPYDKVHPHTLGMVIASAEAIEKEMKLDQSNRRLTIAIEHFRAIMESISEGLIGIDNKGEIRDINLFARKILKVKEEEIIGKNIDTILNNEDNTKMIKAIKNGKKYEEEEVYFKTKNRRKISCIANVTPIKDLVTNNVEGVVITFKEAKVVHNMINKIVGAEARFTFNNILGNCDSIKETIKLARLSAKTDATILLLGESGTGKEMFAQAIHNESKRRRKPFIFLNCGAIPRELVASELFGYVEGAFTGARRGGHPGKFELAEGGTIFLDEIGDMPLDTQANLLRVLETKQVVRVGGHDVIPIDVRVIAATHKDLKKEVERGNFRQDLYYRLNVMPIHIPPLKERKEDIKDYIDYFFKKFNNLMNKNIIGISESFYNGMSNYDWPGNVRELQNVMQLVVNTVDKKNFLEYEDLPNYMKTHKITKQDNSDDELLTLEEIERMAIIKTIDRVNGNLTLASKILGVGRSTLYRKIEKYGLKIVSK